MDKIKVDSGAAFFYPMPVVLVGSVVGGKVNVMPVGWISRVNYEPPLFMVALGPHHTNKGIEKNKEFSINVPDVSLIEQTDYCGLVSGSTTDKSEVFDIFYGALGKAPLIRECPICMSCTLYDTIKLPFDILYIGEVKEVFTEERYMTDKKLDITKINPFTLTMPDNHYWSLGDNLGKAWNIGNNYKKK
ncbi:MAG TPA: flavin reductase family protein [Syntrophales bacterium]|nr:flavin reductase family protein [Syntrophales bacterium]HPQ43927.1 flavin reductase family protein [Syntrophales bacterium]